METIITKHKTWFLYFLSIVFSLLTGYIGNAQSVGINTSDPKSSFEINGSSGQTVTTVTASTELDATQSIVICNNGSTAITLTLPAVTTCSGRIYAIKRNASSTASVTISGTIDGVVNLILKNAGEAATLFSNGTEWKTISNYNSPSSWSITGNTGTDLNLKGFNLVGNPFPSSADWQAVSGWTRSNLVTSGSGFDMWIWNPSAANYGVVNSASGSGTNGVTRYIAPMQGFFVRAESAGNLGLTNSVRVHNGAGSWLKKGTGTDINVVSININSEAGNGFDEVRLVFDSKLNEPGAMKLFSHVLTAPSLYLPLQGENLSVRYLTDTVDNPAVPLMFKPGMDGEYSLQFTFDPDQFETVVLEDRQYHLFKDLKVENRYIFKSSKTDDQTRFVLHFASVEDPGKIELPATIYTYGNQLIIDLTMITGETEVMVCDVMGRLLLQKKLHGETQNNINVSSKSQMLIVSLKNQTARVYRKIMWINR